MKIEALPGIIRQRWSEACANPSIQQWRSIGLWCDDFAELCDAEAETAHLACLARELADEAYRNMVALQPAREEAA